MTRFSFRYNFLVNGSSPSVYKNVAAKCFNYAFLLFSYKNVTHIGVKIIRKPTHRTAGGSFCKIQIFHFTKYRFSFHKIQIFILQIKDFTKYRFFISQITDFHIAKYRFFISQNTDFHFAKYRFSFCKLQISQNTDFHFANYRFSFHKLQISQNTDFHFVSFRFVSFGKLQ